MSITFLPEDPPKPPAPPPQLGRAERLLKAIEEYTEGKISYMMDCDHGRSTDYSYFEMSEARIRLLQLLIEIHGNR